MKLYDEAYIINYARQHSPFYKEYYKNLPAQVNSVTELPLVDQTDFWAANTSDETNTLLTDTMKNGVAFKSGGTTSAPKFSIYTKEEWATLCELSGLALMYNGIKTGDKVANLFYGGQLYASFLYSHDNIQNCPISITEYPIMGSTPVPEMLHLIEQFKINVLVGVPTTIVTIYQYAKEHKIDLSFVDKIYFGGETFFPDQREFVASISPGIQIRSYCYALVDGGLGGFCDDSCGFNEHRSFDYAIVLEIIDEDTSEVIHETNREGKLVVTSLYRLLQPMIRYPLGDRGVWLEPEGTFNRKFKLLGRSEEGARIGPISIYYDDIRGILTRVKEVNVLNYQLIVSHVDGKDKLTFYIATDDSENAGKYTSDFLRILLEERHFIADEMEAGHIHEPEFIFGTIEDLQYNERTGKVKRIIDNRIKL
ncbi:phenylacetate-CoA ligase [Dysgonomonadaceae bacterium PH5-43]|nr:phenylacetate-CoA ligase [Dysgonomonadaceae bacterium PH5-43]